MRFLSRIALSAYSVWFWALGFAWMTLVLVPAALARVFGWPWMRVPFVQRPMGLTPRLNGTRFRVTYDPGYDPTRVCVYAQNHVNLFDAHTACAVIRNPFCGMMNAWQMRVPIYGWLMWLTDGIPVPPRPLERARKLPAAFRERAARGISVLTFPEAHRTTDGRVHAFKRGVTQLAKDAGLPIVPIAVRGMFEIMQKGSPLVRPGGVVHVWVGPHLETEGLDKRQMQALTRAIETMIRTFVEDGVVPNPADDWPPAPRPEASADGPSVRG